MPIYRVEWPKQEGKKREVSLVKARTQEELVDTLDQVADPSQALISQYTGNFFLSFKIPEDFGINEEACLEEIYLEGAEVNDGLYEAFEKPSKHTLLGVDKAIKKVFDSPLTL